VSKHALVAVPQAEASKAEELRDATFASLEGRACTEASHALTETVNEQVVHQLTRAAAKANHNHRLCLKNVWNFSRIADHRVSLRANANTVVLSLSTAS
jgi:hypothetical protein